MSNENSQYKATNKYKQKAYDRIEFNVKKGMKEVIKNRAKDLNKSTQKYINDLIEIDINTSLTNSEKKD